MGDSVAAPRELADQASQARRHVERLLRQMEIEK